MESHALKRTSLVPIRVEFETDTLRIRDCFVWNMNDTLTKPETFAKIFCHDLDIPLHPWADTVTNQIRAQLEEHESVAALELGSDGAMDVDATLPNAEELSECRVILSVSFPPKKNCRSLNSPQIDVQIANHHLMDHIEWDLLSPLTPEAFSAKL